MPFVCVPSLPSFNELNLIAKHLSALFEVGYEGFSLPLPAEYEGVSTPKDILNQHILWVDEKIDHIKETVLQKLFMGKSFSDAGREYLKARSDATADKEKAATHKGNSPFSRIKAYSDRHGEAALTSLCNEGNASTPESWQALIDAVMIISIAANQDNGAELSAKGKMDPVTLDIIAIRSLQTLYSLRDFLAKIQVEDLDAKVTGYLAESVLKFPQFGAQVASSSSYLLHYCNMVKTTPINGHISKNMIFCGYFKVMLDDMLTLYNKDAIIPESDNLERMKKYGVTGQDLICRMLMGLLCPSRLSVNEVAFSEKDLNAAVRTAAVNGKHEALSVLIEHPFFDPKSESSNGNTALAWAVEKGHAKCQSILEADTPEPDVVAGAGAGSGAEPVPQLFRQVSLHEVDGADITPGK